MTIASLRTESGKVVLASVVVLLAAIPAAGEWDVIIEITDLHVTKDTDPAFNDPDPYVILILQRPEPGFGVVGLGTTPVASGQPVCTHPHAGQRFVAPHFNPISLDWWVMDDDLVIDDVMTSGTVGLSPGGGPVTTGSNGPAASIDMTISQVPSECGGNWTTSLRDLPLAALPGELATTTLQLHINEVDTPDFVTLYEQLPSGFTFLAADLPPTRVTDVPLGPDEGTVTLVEWDFPAPSFVNQSIHYEMMVPIDEGQLRNGVFGSQILVRHGPDEETLFCMTGTNDIRIPEPTDYLADFDVDGDVDGDDFLIWQAGFKVDDRGDANGDGVTDGDDFLIWQSEFGEGGGPENAAVPEPASAMLLILGMVGAIFRARRHELE